DGSRAEMCGNGIRCVAKLVHDRGIVRSPEVRIETDAGLKTVRVFLRPDGLVGEAEVDMGPPILERGRIPFRDGGDPAKPAIQVPIEVLGRTFLLTAVSMGNPHAVVRLDVEGSPPPGRDAPLPLAEVPLAEWGPRFERHPFFPDRTNVELIAVRSRREIDFRVWERGSGETLACGTGACAALVACVLNGWCDREATVHLRGGDLRVRWPDGGSVLMTGPAVEVYGGEWRDR
ncbi:MAG: diaminopimelate epimerase, partial [Planctomycetes bacterium]|nr:diaminopimelate epimerase [Planctomycetota bacterium]